jgi:hypothetical protein
VQVFANETTIVNLTLGSPLIAGSGIAGNGLFKFLSEVFKVTVGVILDILQHGLGTLWDGILASLDIFRAGKIGDQFMDPAYWADFFDDAYKAGKKTFVIDDCVQGEFGAGEKWSSLSKEQKLNRDLQECILAATGGGYTSGTIAPEFMRQWF